jgi:hypothetical protein
MSKQVQIINQTNSASNKSRDLILSIILDLVGMATFLIPALGEFGDVIWAPIAAYLMTRIYKGFAGKIGGIFAFLEEIIPFTDFIPSFTIMWFYTYVIKGEKSN